jgi:hypothetical protein
LWKFLRYGPIREACFSLSYLDPVRFEVEFAAMVGGTIQTVFDQYCPDRVHELAKVEDALTLK